jgi:hypothetical protein
MVRINEFHGWGLLTLSTIALTTAGCTWFQTDASRGFAERGQWDENEPRVYTTAEIRVISQRKHPQTGQNVICTEPTPDVAKALSTATQLSLKAGTKTGASGEAGLSGGSAEAIAELAGRSTALIALRDGLYRACEAYANGTIGSDAYGLVLSRYGQLMTTLFLGEDIRGAAAAAAAPVTSPSLITINPSAGSQSKNSNSSGTNSSGTNSNATKPGGNGTPNGGDAANTETTNKESGALSSAPGLIKVANTTDVVDRRGEQPPTNGATPVAGDTLQRGASPAPAPALPAGAPKGSNGAPPGSNNPKGAPASTEKSTQNPSTQGNSSTGASGSKGGLSAVAAVALARMNEDYFDLDVNFMHQLVIACINEYDPTRVRIRAVSEQTLNDATGALDQEIRGQQQQLAQLRQQRQQLGQMQQAIQLQQRNLDQLERQLELQEDPPLQSPSPSSPNPSEESSTTANLQAAVAALVKDLPDTTQPIIDSADGENPWLRQLCPSLANIKTLVVAENSLLTAFAASGHPAADVNPDLGLKAEPAESRDGATKPPSASPNQHAPASPPKRSQAQPRKPSKQQTNPKT